MVQAPGMISNIKTMSKCLRVTFDVQEMDPACMAILFSLNEKYGQIVFAEAEEIIKEKQINIPDYVPIEKMDKTPSKRLRDVLYKVWQTNGGKGNSDDFYRNQMEVIINHFKGKIKKDY